MKKLQEIFSESGTKFNETLPLQQNKRITMKQLAVIGEDFEIDRENSGS